MRTGASEFRRLFWVHSNKPNEMLLGIYGLSTSTPTLRAVWPERTIGASELPSINYKYKDAELLKTPIDHITCHADGRFHMKTRNDRDTYVHQMQRTEALGADTPIFLEFFLITDVSYYYEGIRGNVKLPNVWFGIGEDQYLRLRGMFSGVNFPAEHVMTSTMSQFEGTFGGHVLESGTLKGVIMGSADTISGDALAGRPRGTILGFKFPVASDAWHLKTFLFD